ncbi:homodimeric type dihydroorotase [Venturia nashicola]|uniref:dihydroorotase n=1 Tax=Venturia nashicola TaxID=86259 RepID=A0A4Z1PI25_9PEZI|nr:homodimeric type dihydroorotase [Venturia nashicola]
MPLEKLNGLELPAAADFHVHLRDGKMMELVTPTIRKGGVNTVYVMPNLVPPLTKVKDVLDYKTRLEKLAPGVNFLMSLYLHTDITPETIIEAKKAGITGVKSYPAGVTTNSSSGVVDYDIFFPVFEVYRDSPIASILDILLNLHGESPSTPGSDVTVLNAEEKFLPTLLMLHEKFPKLRIILEHCTSARAIGAVKQCGSSVVATITAHHLFLTVDDVVADPFCFCKPVAKTPEDRDALLRAAVSGNPKFFLGTDSAPHPAIAKRGGADGRGKSAAGVFTQPYATQTVLSAFEEGITQGVIKEEDVTAEKLEGFFSGFGRAFYKSADSSKEKIRFERKGVSVDEILSLGELEVVPFRADHRPQFRPKRKAREIISRVLTRVRPASDQAAISILDFAAPGGTMKSEPVGSLGLAHHPTLLALQTAAKDCDICALIEESVNGVVETLELAKQEEFYAAFDETGPPIWEFWLSKRKDGEDGFSVWCMASESKQAYLVGAVGFVVDDESPLKNIFRGRIVHEDPMHPAVLKRMQMWVEFCAEHHSKCHPGETHLPSRVLDLADPSLDNDTIRLVEPPSETNAHYASLSHCWGKSQQFTSTKATMSQRMTGIEVAGMPKTFRDAITIARHLGIRYLWIDSLCICQDDGADWERESAKMAGIYMNSYLNLAATRAADDAEGFLGARDVRVHVPLEVTLPAQNGSDKDAISGTIHLFNVPLHLAAFSRSYVIDEEAPLSQRGWVVQERFLAPRTLYFGSSQISFECLEKFNTEDGCEQTTHIYNFDELPPIEITSKGVRKDEGYRGSGRWADMLRLYSSKALSRESDKLPAFSGLARLFQEKLRDSYVAGLWRNNIVQGLCWLSIEASHSRPSTYRAPSWSWASIDGWIFICPIRRFEDIVEVVDVQVQVKGENPYGEVSSGHIELRAPLERISIRKHGFGVEKDLWLKHAMFCWWYGTDEEEVDDEEMNDGCFDIETDIELDLESLELYSLPLVADFTDDDLICVVLIVVPEGEGRYKRVGWSYCDCKEKVPGWKESKGNGELPKVILI